MADPISIASGVVGLTIFALQSSQSLCNLVSGLRASKKDIRELKRELEEFCRVLESVRQVVEEFECELRMLELPLRQCGNACNDLERLISKCMKSSDTSLGAWISLEFRGDSITKFKDMLASHKDTITIALGSATFRKTAITAHCLDEYKEMVSCAKSDLEDRLRELNEKLDSFSAYNPSVNKQNEEDCERIQEEKDSTKQCLKICTEFSEHIKRVESLVEVTPEPLQNHWENNGAKHRSAKLATDNLLEDLKARLTATSIELNGNMESLDQRQKAFPQQQAARISNEDKAVLRHIRQERDSTAECLNICADASEQTEKIQSNVIEDVASVDDSQQVLVSTIGQLITAKRITTGSRSFQICGQMSDDTVRQLCGRSFSGAGRAMQAETAPSNRFQSQYGTGRHLKSEELEVKQVS